MKKTLSVLLALLMVVSTVSFAAPVAVDVTESATNAVVYETTKETTEDTAELAETHDEYGQLVYAVDFEQDDFALSAFTTASAKISQNNIASYMDSAFDFSNVTTYTNAAGDGFDSAKLVTEGGNTYIQGNTQGGKYDGFFRMTKYTLEWPDGYYTFSVDVKTSTASSWTAQCNDTKIGITPAIKSFNPNNSDWQTVVYQTNEAVEGKNTGSDDKVGFYGFFMTPYNSADGVISYDNWKVYYKADTASVVIDSNGKVGVSSITVEGLTPNSNVSVSDLVAKAKAMDADLIGLAATPDGAILAETSTVPVEYYEKLYAVYGYDITVMANGNSDVQDTTISGVDSRKSYTVAHIIEMLNGLDTDKVLRGISKTPNGEPMAESEVINSESILYLIWEADESEYGTLLFDIDFEQYEKGYEINQTDNNYKTVETFDSDAITNGEFTINWQLLDGGAVAVEENGNKYLRGNKAYAQFRINNSKYNDASAPMATGIYTVVADAIDFGTTGRKMSAISQVGSNIAAEMVDTWSGKTNTWDKVVGRWQNIEYRDMTWYFKDEATTDVGFDNIKLYFEPVDETVFYVTVNANGKSGVSNEVVAVDAGNAVTVAELKAKMPGCIGIAETATGDILPDSASILPKYNKTVYAVWGFDVTLKAGQNTEMSDIVVSGIDNRTGRGTTIGELVSKINNTTGRTLRGLSKTNNGDILSADTAVTAASTYYMIWELDESDFGTLIFDIDFEKAGLTAPTATVKVADIASAYNSDLVKGNISFILGKSSSVALDNTALKTDGTNTYLEGDANLTGDFYNFVQINEWSSEVDWLNGTYTYIIDFKTDKAIDGCAKHVNNLGKEQGSDITVLDDYSQTVVNAWDTIAFQYNGKLSNDAGIGSLYIAPNISKTELVEGKIAVDNIRLYFKTDETRITIDVTENGELEDVIVPVSTSTGITVGELIAELNKYSTSKTLLGLSYSPTGELLAEDLRITPKYQQTLYAVWHRKGDNPMLDDYLGKLLFAVDFEREEVIEKNWDGFSPLGGGTWGNSEVISKIATLYDTTIFNDNVNSKARFITNDRNEEIFDAEIHTSVDGENHFLQGSTGPQTYGDDTDAGTKWPQVAFLNYGNVVTGNGIYTVFIDAMGTGTGSFNPHTDMASYNPKKIDPVTYEEIAAWSYTKNSWGTYAYSYEITDGSKIPNSNAYFNFSDYNNTVAFDNYKLYYKPFTATITLLPGELKNFGIHTVENISTTGEHTGNDIVAGIQCCLDSADVEFLGLMDEYGEMLDLTKPLVIPCDMTYTIIWGEAESKSPKTWQTNSIRYSTNESARGIRFAADVIKANTNGLDETVTEYGWIVTRPELLEEAGLCPYAFTKESKLSKPVIVGKNYGYDVTEEGDDGRKHFAEDDSKVVITAVVYGLKPANYKNELLVRPYIVIDGVTYYGKPWQRSMYDTAIALKDKGYPDCDDATKAYIDEIIEKAI